MCPNACIEAPRDGVATAAEMRSTCRLILATCGSASASDRAPLRRFRLCADPPPSRVGLRSGALFRARQASPERAPPLDPSNLLKPGAKLSAGLRDGATRGVGASAAGVELAARLHQAPHRALQLDDHPVGPVAVLDSEATPDGTKPSLRAVELRSCLPPRHGRRPLAAHRATSPTSRSSAARRRVRLPARTATVGGAFSMQAGRGFIGRPAPRPTVAPQRPTRTAPPRFARRPCRARAAAAPGRRPLADRPRPCGARAR